ncbi:MAG: tetratricopeptide repeat protein [Acidimicrobiia bacterium]|nr:tetratricopeptide repeat protein [Acidimicrobiia bacterium]
MTCASCGSEAPAGARFCPSCGHPLVARHDERRVATVLFADLVGFTRLSESADPEHVKNLVDRCFEQLAADIVLHGGQVDKVIGDALVAIFGAPVAHEDDAERAVRAALRMQIRLDQLRSDSGMELQMRVGINTGEVLVGALRAGGDYTAMGDVVNTASRLQSIAQPGQVVVGPATFQATANAINYEPLGALSVKGREEAVDAWHATGAVAPPGVRRARPLTPLVGRDEEMVVLGASLVTAVTRRRVHFTLMVGEAGVGKTRLAAEIGRIAEDVHGARILTGHCIPYGENDAWYPIGAMIASACAVGLDEDTETQHLAARHETAAVLGLDATDPEVSRIADGLLHLMGKPIHSDAVDPVRAHEDALRAGLAFIGALAEQRPLVLILSDLHWADPELLEFLPRLLKRLSGRPAMLMATARVEFADDWSPPPGRHNVVNVHLDPLDAEYTDALLEALLPDVSPELRAGLRDRSGGNPFFVEELAAMACDGNNPGELPATLHGLVAARLDRLSAKERSVLEDAAVIGASGPVALVEVLAASHGGGAQTTLESLADEGLVNLVDGEFAFRNELTREIAYGTLTKAERARRHGLLAKTLANEGERTGRIEEVMERLGYHFDLAASLLNELGSGSGMPPEMAREAASFLARAGRRAEQREDWKSAEKHLSGAIMLVAPSEVGELTSLHVARARSRAEQRDTVGAREDLATVYKLASEVDDPHAYASAATILGDIQYKEGDLSTATQTLDGSVARWRELDDPSGLADALRFSGMTALFRGNGEKAGAEIEEALALFRRAHDQRGEAWALQNLAWLSFIDGDYQTAEARLETSAATFGELGDWGGVSWALGLLAWVRYTQGRLEEARELALRIQQESRELGNRWAAAMMTVLLANVAVWTGNVETAIDESREAVEIFRDLGDAWGELQAMSPLILAQTMSGQYRQATALIDEIETVGLRVLDEAMNRLPGLIRVAIAVMSGSESAYGLARDLLGDVEGKRFINDEQRMVLGLAHFQNGDHVVALEMLEHARGLAIGAGSDAATNVALAMALTANDRAPEALELCTEIETTLVTFTDRYRHALARAFAHARGGDTEQADVAIQSALAIVEATGAVLDRALAQIGAATLWEGTDRGDTARRFADSLLDATTMDPVGWRRVFTLMAGAENS